MSKREIEDATDRLVSAGVSQGMDEGVQYSIAHVRQLGVGLARLADWLETITLDVGTDRFNERFLLARKRASELAMLVDYPNPSQLNF